MFDVGFWELLLIFGMGLMILGPERMPRVAAQIGRWIGRAQRTANQFRRKLQRELELEDLMRDGIVPKHRPAAR
ncbi:MAG: Sec-independent protein translocase protein TatB, partial [Rhodospirillaceae bacterium]|nr:Sec-independent protein translocase protein TatB [Rhodospirillaceae bacterium]